MVKGFKKIIIALSLGIISVGISGCGTDLQNFAETTYPQAIADRGEANKKIAAKFKDLGALSEASYEKVCQNIDKQVEKYQKTDNKTASLLGSAVSEYRVLAENNPSYVTVINEDVSYDVYKGEEIDLGSGKQSYDYFWDIAVPTSFNKSPSLGELNLSHFVISNYLCATKFNKKFYNNSFYSRNEQDVKPIELISQDVKDEINQHLKAQVYVLRQDIATVDGMSTTDGIISMVQQAMGDGDSKSVNVELLNNYFSPAVDEDNKPVYLIDLEDEEYDIIKNSRTNSGDKDEPGYDLILDQYNEDVLKVRFTEFDSSAYDKLNELIGLNVNKYLFVNSGKSDWRVYIMEYPISVIDELTDNGDNTVNVSFKESGLGINIKTGSFVKYDPDGESFLMAGKEVTTNDYYLTTSGAQNNNEFGVSSLILKGITTTTIKNTSEKDLKFYCGRLILRDYLEATYAPEFVAGDTLAVFGRKIRLDMNSSYWTEEKSYNGTTKSQFELNYPKGVDIATFVDKQGEEVPNSTKLQITDFCDISLLNTDNADDAVVKTIVQKGAQPGEVPAQKVLDGKNATVADLKRITVDNEPIKPTLMFPSETLGIGDFTSDNEQKQRFYCIATKHGLFESALFSSWIESKASEASLDWWNSYLSDNGFVYKVDHGELNDYLSSNYAYELSENGIIILDLEVVAKIQEQFTEDANTSKTHKIRTFFMVLGWAIICYSIVLMLAWIIDTNTDIGIKLFEKMTFGNWVAIKYDEDVPSYNTNERTYLTGGHALIRCILLIAVGILLIMINVFDVVLVLIKLFGQLASKLEEMIQGIR